MDDQTHEELISQYRVDVENIENIKRRQWIGMYYGTLLIVALFYVQLNIVDKFENEISIYISFFISIFATGILLFILTFLYLTKGTLNGYRERMYKIVKMFSKKFKSILDPKNIISGKGQDVFILGGFSAVLIISWWLLLSFVLGFNIFAFLLWGFLSLFIWVVFTILCTTK